MLKKISLLSIFVGSDQEDGQFCIKVFVRTMIVLVLYTGVLFRQFFTSSRNMLAWCVSGQTGSPSHRRFAMQRDKVNGVRFARDVLSVPRWWGAGTVRSSIGRHQNHQRYRPRCHGLSFLGIFKSRAEGMSSTLNNFKMVLLNID